LEEKRKDAEELRRVEEYAKKKDALDQLRKDREEQKFQEKQETRQRLVDHQARVLASI
jgi:hypothetical protein